jgi:hypothetical protein
MADIAQVLATGGTTIVAVGVGAGLTYWFGALNMRHQEEREDRTRWYDARREAYARFLDAIANHSLVARREDASTDDLVGAATALTSSFSAIRLVGSPDAIRTAGQYLAAFLRPQPRDASTMQAAMRAFEAAARTDLGHPLTERMGEDGVH